MEGKIVRIVCATPRLTPMVLDGITNATDTTPSSFEGELTERRGEYAYYLQPGFADLQKFADEMAEIQGVLRADVVDPPVY